MSTPLLRRIAVAATITLAAGAAASGPASAFHPAETHSSVAAKRALDCQTGVLGALANNKVVERITGNLVVQDEVTSKRALPFRPSGTSYFGAKQVTGGVDQSFLMLDPKGSPRVVTLKVRDGEATAALTTKEMLNPRFPARLYTGSGGFHVFTVSKSGVLKRWTTYQNRKGKLFFDDAVTVRKGLKTLQTLSFQSRIRIGGKQSDVLYGTTKSGALQQFRVPVKNPTKEKVVTVKRTGFKGTTGLSLSYCNGKPSYVSIIAINAKGNSARWYTLSGSTQPRAANLTSRGAMPSDVSWRLHATL